MAAASGPAFAHGGGLDARGCHTQRSTGEYHCHPGPSGDARVIDGDTIVINGKHIRLQGIDAVESAQTCGRDGGRWPCGRHAGFALARFIHGRALECRAVDRDDYGRIVAICFADGVDINEWMVREGWAVAYRKYSTAYVEAEESARAAKRNIWSGTFTMPEAYRHKRR
jgi:endonuclease YncB( thermonuclease family)